MKRLLSFLLAITICLAVAVTAYADVNADGGGGGMGSGSGDSYWSVGDDGLRVSVVREKDNATIKIIDFSNKKQNEIYAHFSYKNKLQYRGTSKILPNTTTKYVSKQPTVSLPHIVSPSGTSNVAAIKQYFSDKQIVEYISNQMGLEFYNFISGDYVLLLEPIAYFTYYGKRFAMTATEAAYYDQLTNGDLKYQMQALTHQNLPLSLFLERSALGFAAWGGATSGIMANNDIKSFLGLATVVFDEDDYGDSTGGIPTDKDYVYRTDTEVITSVSVRAGAQDITPDDNAKVTFNIGGKKMSFSFVLPKGEKELAWVRWRTPKTPCEMSVSVSTTHGTIDTGNISIAVVELIEKTPPNPRGTDRNDRFTRDSYTKSFGTVNYAKWDEWWAAWQSKWEWHSNWNWITEVTKLPDRWVNPLNESEYSLTYKSGWRFKKAENIYGGHWEDNGYWVDNGYWKFDYRTYSASLSAVNAELPVDAHCPTAYMMNGKWCIKSGYGYGVSMPTRVTYSAPSLAITPVQSAMALFPEFNYGRYNRLLVGDGRGFNSTFAFKPNPYSQWNSPTHFTPIWYPDAPYNISLVAFDVWTPAGQLYVSTEAGGYIDGDVYDDWHIGPW